MNAAYDSLLGRVLPQVLPCPKSMAMDAIQTVAVDFCEKSGVWEETITDQIGPCEQIFAPVLPKDAAIYGIAAVELDGRQASASVLNGREIALERPCGKECLITVKLRLRPSRLAGGMPADLLEEYGDCLVYGAIAKLKAMRGNHIEWTDPDGAALNYQLYQEELGKAKARKFRKRTGVLYVNTGDA